MVFYYHKSLEALCYQFLHGNEACVYVPSLLSCVIVPYDVLRCWAVVLMIMRSQGFNPTVTCIYDG